MYIIFSIGFGDFVPTFESQQVYINDPSVLSDLLNTIYYAIILFYIIGRERGLASCSTYTKCSSYSGLYLVWDIWL